MIKSVQHLNIAEIWTANVSNQLAGEIVLSCGQMIFWQGTYHTYSHDALVIF